MPRSVPTLSTAMLDAAVDLIGKDGGLGSVAVSGLSMHPTFAGVERLAVEFSPQDLALGDVLVFRQRGMLVVHRLIQRQRHAGGLRLRTRGDGAIGLDPWVDPDSVVGRIVAVGYPDGTWRNLRNVRARLYARLLALHDLFWGGLGAVALGYAGKRGPRWQGRLGRLDGFKLRLGHFLFFRTLHPEIPPPRFDGPGTAAGSAGAEARCYTRGLGPAAERKTRMHS